MNEEQVICKLHFTKDQLARLFGILQDGQNPRVAYVRDALTMSDEAVEVMQKKFYELELLLIEVMGEKWAHEYIFKSLEREL